MKKMLEGKNKNLPLVGAALVGAVASKVMHLEAIIAAIVIVLILVSFKDTKLKKWVVRFIKTILIVVIVMTALVWHNIFCNTKEETNNELAQQDVVTDEQPVVEDQPEIPVVEEVSEEVNSRSNAKKSFYN